MKKNRLLYLLSNGYKELYDQERQLEQRMLDVAQEERDGLSHFGIEPITDPGYNTPPELYGSCGESMVMMTLKGGREVFIEQLRYNQWCTFVRYYFWDKTFRGCLEMYDYGAEAKVKINHEQDSIKQRLDELQTIIQNCQNLICSWYRKDYGLAGKYAGAIYCMGPAARLIDRYNYYNLNRTNPYL